MTTITLPPDIDESLTAEALRRGTTPERLALDTLRHSFVANGAKTFTQSVASASTLPDEPLASEEISAPCDLPLPGTRTKVHARERSGWLPDMPSL